jgi:uncharacterized membrane protein
MKQAIIMIMIFLSIVGIADSGYITYEKFSGAIPVCGEGFDCGSVLSSPYSQIGPIPLSLLGFGYYTTILLVMAGKLLEIPAVKKTWPVLALTSFGFAFSLFLIGLMAFVIEAWCLYCLISAGTSTLLFGFGIALHYLQQKEVRLGS